MNDEWSGNSRDDFGAVASGTPIGPSALTLSPAANERYWRAVGLDHPALVAGTAYPLVAANTTVLAWLETCDVAMIQTRQWLRIHRAVTTPVEFTTTGAVTDRFERRGRTYVTVRVEVSSEGAPVWTSEVDFTPAATLASPDRGTVQEPRTTVTPRPAFTPTGAPRTFAITDDAIRAYSRRGNYHSDAGLAADLGLPGLVAQGTQVCGPAFGLLLDEWGDAVLADAELDLRFLGVVTGGTEVSARAAIDGDHAALEVRAGDRVVAVGTARRYAPGAGESPG